MSCGIAMVLKDLLYFDWKSISTDEMILLWENDISKKIPWYYFSWFTGGYNFFYWFYMEKKCIDK